MPTKDNIKKLINKTTDQTIFEKEEIFPPPHHLPVVRHIYMLKA